MGSTSWDSENKNSKKSISQHYVAQTDRENVNNAEDVQTDAELIIQYTRTPKKPPEYKPRSRKLDDLPGGIRVPIIRRDDSRVKPRLDAGREGLEELRALREAQQTLISDAKKTYQREHEQAKLTRFPKSFSASFLSCIAEENNSSKHFNDDDNSVFSEKEFAMPSQHENQPNRSEYLLSRVRTPNASGRRASIQIDSDYFRQCAAVAATKENRPAEPSALPIRHRSRRPSFQVDSIITAREHTISTAQLISEMKLHYNSPGPMRAVMRQYGSSSDLNVKHNSSENTSNLLKRGSLDNSSSAVNDGSLSHTSSKEANVVLGRALTKIDKHHSRGESSTSDYYGSSERIDDRSRNPTDKVEPSPDLNRTRNFSEFGSPRETSERFSVSDMSDEGFSYDDLPNSPVSKPEKRDAAENEQDNDKELVSEESYNCCAKVTKIQSTKGLLETSL